MNEKCLSASVPAPDDHSTYNMHSAEADGEGGFPRNIGIGKGIWTPQGPEKSGGAEGHHGRAHHGQHAYRKGASRHDPGTVEQQPHAGEESVQAEFVEHFREKHTRQHGGGQIQGEAPRGPGHARLVEGAHLPHHRREARQAARQRHGQPAVHPPFPGGVESRDVAAAEGDEPHDKHALARDAGKGRGALHGLANEGEVFHGAFMEGDGGFVFKLFHGASFLFLVCIHSSLKVLATAKS